MCMKKSMNILMRQYCMRWGLFMFLGFSSFQTCSSLYDFVCHENQIYKPHVKAYKDNRNGAPINLNPTSTTNNIALGGGPNFYPITTNNTYICINGPAYLYFSKTTALGEVFETPKMEVYDHICDTYNVNPGKGATRANVTERLHAILLMGDETNYYARPALQLFTAPYYDKWRKTPKGGEGLYINATSLIVFGKEVCFIEKDNMPIRIKTIVTPADIEATEQHYCKLGYSKLLLENLTDVTNDNNNEKLPMKNSKKVLENVDFSIRNGGCSFAGYDQAGKTFQASLGDIKTKVATFIAPPTEAYDKPSQQDIDAEPKQSKKTKLQAQFDKNEKLKYIADKIREILTSSVITDLTDNGLQTEIQSLIDSSAAAQEARNLRHQNEVATQLKKLELIRHPYNYTAIKDSIAEIPGSGVTVPDISDLETKWDTISGKMKDSKKAVAKLDKLFIELQKKKPLNSTEIDNAIIAAEDDTVQPVTIELSVVSEDCKRMHKSTETCAAAKPNQTEVCNLFKNSLGHAPPDLWKDSNKWKDDVLDTMADIFNNACFRLPKKFTRNVHRIFKYYLTNPKIFNKKTALEVPPNPSPETPPNPAPDTPPNPAPETTPNSASDTHDPNQAEKPFWRHIKAALAECKKDMQRLFIIPPPPNNKSGEWKLKRNHENIRIIHHNEQAELEYTFNWVIDWQYKIFATVLGLCMPAYESKLPLITSRFYSLYTEAFIIPLRETWVNSKDNKVFHWILGEFKHHDTDLWVKNCMEAAFLQHKKVEYRPPRCVLVNGYKEHNYYISGTFPYGHKGRYAK